MNCKVCNMDIRNRTNKAKYCLRCSMLVNRQRAIQTQRLRYRIEREIWSNLKEDERVEKMNVISNKILNDDDSLFEKALKELNEYKKDKEKIY